MEAELALASGEPCREPSLDPMEPREPLREPSPDPTELREPRNSLERESPGTALNSWRFLGTANKNHQYVRI